MESTPTSSEVSSRSHGGSIGADFWILRALGGALQGLVRCRALQVRPFACVRALRLAQVRRSAQVRLLLAPIYETCSPCSAAESSSRRSSARPPRAVPHPPTVEAGRTGNRDLRENFGSSTDEPSCSSTSVRCRRLAFRFCADGPSRSRSPGVRHRAIREGGDWPLDLAPSARAGHHEPQVGEGQRAWIGKLLLHQGVPHVRLVLTVAGCFAADPLSPATLSSTWSRFRISPS